MYKFYCCFQILYVYERVVLDNILECFVLARKEKLDKNLSEFPEKNLFLIVLLIPATRLG